MYRAENETGPYTFVGGMTIEIPPALPHILHSPYKPPPEVGCDKIPLTIIDAMSMGFFVDTAVDQKTIYWSRWSASTRAATKQIETKPWA